MLDPMITARGAELQLPRDPPCCERVAQEGHQSKPERNRSYPRTRTACSGYERSTDSSHTSWMLWTGFKSAVNRTRSLAGSFSPDLHSTSIHGFRSHRTRKSTSRFSLVRTKRISHSPCAVSVQKQLGKATLAQDVGPGEAHGAARQDPIGLDARAALPHCEREEPIRQIAAEKAVTTFAEVVQAGAADDDDGDLRSPGVMDSLELRLPFAVLVDLVEYDHAWAAPGDRLGRRLAPASAKAFVVEEEVVLRMLQERLRQGRLPDLARTRDEGHLPPGEGVVTDGSREVSWTIDHGRPSFIGSIIGHDFLSPS